MTIETMDKKVLGRRIYLARKQNALTLRDLSKETGLSHTQIHRIENGTTQSKSAAIKILMSALGVTFVANDAHEEAFYKIYHEMFYSVLYVNYETAKKYFDTLYERRHLYENCGCFTDYYLGMMMVVVHTDHRLDLLEYFYHACEAMKDFYDASKREWFEVMKVLYLSRKHMRKEAFSHAERMHSVITNDHYRGILNYMRGVLLMSDYRYYHESLQALTSAQKLFEDNLNFNRSNRAKGVKQKLYIYLFRYEDFHTSFKESVAYARKSGVLDIYYYIQLNKALYYEFDEAYESALALLKTFEFPFASYYMTKIYAQYKLERDEEALDTMKQFKASELGPIGDLEKRLLDLMAHGIEYGEDDAYLTMLRDFTDKAIKSRHFPMIKQGVSLLTKLLEKKRRYKEAYHYANTLLSIIETIQKGGVF